MNLKGNIEAMNKKDLRKEVLARRNALSELERNEKSMLIAERVIGLEEFRKSNKVLLYSAIRNEVETLRIFQEAKRLKKNIFFPRVMGKEMNFFLVDETTEFEISKFGVCEPKPESTKVHEPSEEDEILVLMPGVVFDEEGNRIGYGGGYYDKYLQWLTDGNIYKKMNTVAVAYDCQIVEMGQIETEPHDIRVDYIITENRVIGG